MLFVVRYIIILWLQSISLISLAFFYKATVLSFFSLDGWYEIHTFTPKKKRNLRIWKVLLFFANEEKK